MSHLVCFGDFAPPYDTSFCKTSWLILINEIQASSHHVWQKKNKKSTWITSHVSRKSANQFVGLMCFSPRTTTSCCRVAQTSTVGCWNVDLRCGRRFHSHRTIVLGGAGWSCRTPNMFNIMFVDVVNHTNKPLMNWRDPLQACLRRLYIHKLTSSM